MNLALSDLADLPLAAALIDRSDAVITRTPEWDGPGPGAVAYPVRRNRLVVRTQPASADCDAVLRRLLTALDVAREDLDDTNARRVEMLAASLRLLAGHDAGADGTSDDVLAFAGAGISGRTALDVRLIPGPVTAVRAPAVAALVLVQLAVNAERHAGVDAVTIESDRSTWRVTWRGTGSPDIATSRRRAGRQRWGLGFGRIAADAIGGAVYPPRDRDDGTVAATLELGIGRLALPLALERRGNVLRATRSWDEETGLSPGSPLHDDPRFASLMAEAGRHPGRIIRGAPGVARAVAGGTWIAIEPDDATTRARDVLAGLVHERALTESVAEPMRSRIGGLALLLACLLGDPMPRVPIGIWNRRMAELSRPFGLTAALPGFNGVGAIDPQVAVLLASESGQGFEVDGDRLWLRVRADRHQDPVVRVLLRPGEDRVPLG